MKAVLVFVLRCSFNSRYRLLMVGDPEDVTAGRLLDRRVPPICEDLGACSEISLKVDIPKYN